MMNAICKYIAENRDMLFDEDEIDDKSAVG